VDLIRSYTIRFEFLSLAIADGHSPFPLALSFGKVVNILLLVAHVSNWLVCSSVVLCVGVIVCVLLSVVVCLFLGF